MMRGKKADLCKQRVPAIRDGIRQKLLNAASCLLVGRTRDVIIISHPCPILQLTLFTQTPIRLCNCNPTFLRFIQNSQVVYYQQKGLVWVAVNGKWWDQWWKENIRTIASILEILMSSLHAAVWMCFPPGTPGKKPIPQIGWCLSFSNIKLSRF